jgi:hypothetical protein
VIEVCKKLKPELDQLDLKETREQYKVVFGLILKLSCLFDFFYSALLAPRNATFYQNEECKDIEDRLEFVNVDDAKEYWQCADKGYEE